MNTTHVHTLNAAGLATSRHARHTRHRPVSAIALALGMFACGLSPSAKAQAQTAGKGQPVAPTSVPLATPSPAAALQGLDCMIQPSLVVQVGSPSVGVIERIDVDRGDFVKRGQVLAQLGTQVERAALAVARERAEQSGEVEAAASVKALAHNDLQRAHELQGEQFVSKAYVERARSEVQVAGGRTMQAEERRRLAQREVDLAAAQLNQRSVRAPIDGVVVDRYMAPGEYVEQKPLLRLAAIDPLRVDVLVPAAAFGRIQPGDRGTVVPELIDRGQHAAVVSTVDRVIDAASNTFRVRLELPNPGHKLPAGLRCTVSFGAATAALPVASAAPAGGLAATTAVPQAQVKPTATARP